MLRMVDCVDDLLGQSNMWILLLMVDLMTAVVLSLVAVETRRYLLQHQEEEEQRYVYNRMIQHSFPDIVDCNLEEDYNLVVMQKHTLGEMIFFVVI